MAKRRVEVLLRGLRRFALVALSVAALGVAATLVLERSLDRPWAKRRIQAAVLGSSGLRVDYGSLRLSLLGGVELRDLVVEAPDQVRPASSELVRVGSVAARWSLGRLLSHRSLVESVVASDVVLDVAVDETGRTSFDEIPSRSPPASTPPTPLSRLAATLLSQPLPVEHMDARRVTLSLTRTDRGAVKDQFVLTGIGAVVHAAASRMDLALGTEAAPLEIDLMRRQGGELTRARGRLTLSASMTPREVAVEASLRVVEQSFATSVGAERWLKLRGAARFDESAGRTTVTVDQAEAGDGSLSAKASLEVPDEGAPVLVTGQADADVAALLRWVPPGLLPVRAEVARVHASAHGLVLGEVPRAAPGGGIEVAADARQVAVDIPAGAVEIAGAKLTLHGAPTEADRVLGAGALALEGVRGRHRNDAFDAPRLDVSLEGRASADGVWSGYGTVRVPSLSLSGGAAVEATGVEVELRSLELHPSFANPARTRGDVSVSAKAESLDAAASGTRVLLAMPALDAHSMLKGEAPYAVEVDVSAREARVTRGGSVVADGAVHLTLAGERIVPDLEELSRSRASARIRIDFGELTGAVTATKSTDAVDADVRVKLPGLRMLRPFVKLPGADASTWDHLGVSLASTFRVEHLGGPAPYLTETTDLALERPRFADVAAASVGVVVASKGTLWRHEADVEVSAHALSIGSDAPTDDRVKVSLAIDRERRSLEGRISAEGRVALSASGNARFDGSRRALEVAIDAHAQRLGRLAPLVAQSAALGGLDLAGLDLGVALHGTLLGVVADVSWSGAVRVEPAPTRTAAFDGVVDVRAAGLKWARGDTVVQSPAIDVHSELGGAPERRTIASRVDAGTLDLAFGPRKIALTNVHHESRLAVMGDLTDPATEIADHLAIDRVEQGVVPEIPVGDVALSVTAGRERDGIIHISDLALRNGASGTTASLSGNLELVGTKRMLSVTGSIGQDLARLAQGDRFSGKGTLSFGANITSSDLKRFVVRATTKLTGVSLKLLNPGITVDEANGEVPIEVSLDVGNEGVGFHLTETKSAFSSLRFADQHPLLAHAGFVSVKRLDTPFGAFAPLVGNLAIEQNVVALQQFEVGVRGGMVSGQSTLVWDGPRSSLELRVRANGVLSSHGEPFDGNFAIVASAADRTIEGRADILRIGPRHLLDLLDVADPTQADPGMNRVRRALSLGYPKRLRLSFDHGFASMHVELGGVASIVSIGELRGIPMGPIIEHQLSALDRKTASP